MTAQATDLTTLATSKQWLGLTTQSDDANLARLISAVSSRVVQYLGHALLPQTITRTVDGQHGTSYLLPDFPIIGLTSLTIDNVLIPAAPNVTQAGWLLAKLNPASETSLSELCLYGYLFTRAKQNVTLVYQAGFQTSESFTPQAGALTYNVVRPWRQTVSVAYASGTLLTAINSGTPAVGQYVPPSLSTAQAETYGYTFAAGDAGQALTITYAYTPESVEQACLEMVARRYREKDRVGQKSMNLGSQVVTYDLSEMTDSIKGLLQPYCKVVWG